MIAHALTCKCEEGIVICTKDDKMLANRQITKSNLEPCNHEEPDIRLFFHVLDEHFGTPLQGAILSHHFVEEEKRLHRMRGAVSPKLLNAF